MKAYFFSVLCWGIIHSIFAQSYVIFEEDNFENSFGVWQSSGGAESNNVLEIMSSMYSIDQYSLQVAHVANTGTQAGYTYGNSLESNRKYRYFSTQGYYNIILKFKWKCNGEAGHDFGTMFYSSDGIQWTTLKNFQSGKGNEIHDEYIVLPKCAEDSGFYLGFSFTADNSFNFQPGLVIDEIDIQGNCTPGSIKPNTPMGLNSVVCKNTKTSITLEPTSSTGNLRWYTTMNCSEYIFEGPAYSILPLEDKTFYVSAYNSQNGCESPSKVAVNLVVKSLPVIEVVSIVDATLGGDGSIGVSATEFPPFIYDWYLNKVAFPQNDSLITGLYEGNYELIVTNNIGCKDSVKVVLLSKAELDIPNAISPNNDSYNDVWKISGIAQWSDFKIELRNMRGELVYKQEATNNSPAYIPFGGYNQQGEKLAPGDYSYVVQSKERKKKYSGILSIKYD